MEERVFGGIVELPQFLEPLQDAAGRPRRGGGFGEAPQPVRFLVPARAAIVVDRQRREHDRHRRRGRGGAGELERFEIRAHHVEILLREDHPRTGRQLRRPHGDRRHPLVIQVRERRAMEQDLVVELRRHLGHAPAFGHQRAPVQRVQGAMDQLALHVAREEAILVLIEQLVAIQPVRERGRE